MIDFNEHYEIPFIGNRYCGPTALAYITRRDPKQAAQVIRMLTGKRAVYGVGTKLMSLALESYGVRYTHRTWVRGSRLKVSKWLAMRATGEWLMVCNTLRGTHYVVVHNGMYFDSMCHLGKPVARLPYMNRDVHCEWQIHRD